jgi:acyl-CoA thioesterase-1
MPKVPLKAALANMVFRVLLCNWLDCRARFRAAAAPASQPLRIVVLGDSLVAGLGLKPSEAFPAQLERALKERGHDVEVINAGVSGDTTAGGLDRVGWAVPERTGAGDLELGANDALRGLDPRRAKSNLDKIITTLKAGGAEVLLAGMLAPRNLGEPYTRAFDAIYPELAAKHGLLLYPFFLDGVAMNAKLNLDDGLHPNSRGVAEITKKILPSVEQLIERARARQAAGTKAEHAAAVHRHRDPGADPAAPVAVARTAQRRRNGSSRKTCTSPCASPATSMGVRRMNLRIFLPAFAQGPSR